MPKEIVTGKFISSKKYGAAVQLYHKQNGDIVYYAYYHDTTDLDVNGNAKRKRLKIGSKRDGVNEQFVKAQRDKIIVSLRTGELPPILQKKTVMLTFGSIAELYISHRLSHVYNDNDNKNINNDKSILKNHLSKFIKLNPSAITNEDIEKFKVLKLSERAPKTVNNILTLLRSIFNFGIDQELITTSPRIKLLTGIDNHRERYFSQDEIKLILEHIKDNLILTMFVKLSLSTGGRLETIRNIKVKDINFSDMTISLIDLKGMASGKNNATYTGFFKEDIKQDLQTFVQGLSPNSYIFSFSTKCRVSKDYIQNNLQKLFNKLFNQGLELDDTKNRAVVHTLRHTFATQLAKNGVPIFTIQKLMNHSEIEMTLRYAKFSPENGQDAINNLNLF